MTLLVFMITFALSRVDDWMEANELAATAFQCWESLQKTVGINVSCCHSRANCPVAIWATDPIMVI